MKWGWLPDKRYNFILISEIKASESLGKYTKSKETEIPLIFLYDLDHNPYFVQQLKDEKIGPEICHSPF